MEIAIFKHLFALRFHLAFPKKEMFHKSAIVRYLYLFT